MAVLDFSDLKGTGQIIKYNNEPYQIIWSNFMRTAQRKCQFLYSDDEGAHFMNPETFETLVVPKIIVEDQIKFLKEGMDTIIMFFEDRPIALDLPVKINTYVWPRLLRQFVRRT